MKRDPIGFLVVGAIGLVFMMMFGTVIVKSCGGLNWEYSNGSRSGVVQKLSKKGVVWKTWEGEMNLGYNTSSKDGDGHLTIAPAIFYFSVSDESVAKIVKDAEASGKRVTVDYKEYILRGWDKGATSYDVTGIVQQ